MNDLIQLLIYLVIGGILVWAVQLILGLFTLPAQIKTLILVIVALVVIVWLLRAAGIFVL